MSVNPPPLVFHKYAQRIDPQAEERLKRLVEFLHKESNMFYEISEKSEGKDRYVRVLVSIKVAS